MSTRVLPMALVAISFAGAAQEAQEENAGRSLQTQLKCTEDSYWIYDSDDNYLSYRAYCKQGFGPSGTEKRVWVSGRTLDDGETIKGRYVDVARRFKKCSDPNSDSGEFFLYQCGTDEACKNPTTKSWDRMYIHKNEGKTWPFNEMGVNGFVRRDRYEIALPLKLEKYVSGTYFTSTVKGEKKYLGYATVGKGSCKILKLGSWNDATAFTFEKNTYKYTYDYPGRSLSKKSNQNLQRDLIAQIKDAVEKSE